MAWHESIEAYITIVCQQVRWKKARLPIAAELGDHLADQAAAYVADGLSEDAARAKAVASMGDPIHTGTLLDASYRPQLPWPLLFGVGALVILGLLLRTQVLGQRFGAIEGLALLLGLGGFFLLYNLDWRYLLKGTWPLYAGLVFLSLLAIDAFGFRLRGRWLLFFGRGYTMVPCLMLFFPIVYGLIIYRFRGKGLKHVLLCGALFALPGLLWIAQPAWSIFLSAALPCLVILTIAILGGHFECPRRKALLLVWGGTLAVVLLGVLWATTEPYRMMRLSTSMPWNSDIDPYGSGYFPSLIRGFLQHATFFGAGEVTNGSTLNIMERFAQGRFLTGEIPVSFALSLLIHQYGWWVLAALTLALALLFGYLFRVCHRQGSMLGRLLGYGATLSLLMQFLGYIISNLGFVLFDALPLPFLTYGNVSLAVNLALVGLLTAVLAGGSALRDGVLWQKGPAYSRKPMA